MDRWTTQLSRIAVPLAVAFSVAPAQDPAERPRFSTAIRAFVSADSVSPPPKGAIEFIGSSILRQWTSVSDDMKPLPVFNRAFGGSRTLDLLDHMDAVVLPYEPKIIVYYCGSNDINGNLSVDTIVSRVGQFVSRVHARLPRTKIFVVSVNKAPQKRKKWGTVDSVNHRLMAMTSADPRLGFIDVNRVLFSVDGQVKGEFFKPDSLHLTPPAYVQFTAAIRPIIEKAWNSVDHK